MLRNVPRRWLRFRLRSAIILMSILAAFFAWRGNVVREQRSLLFIIESLEGTAAVGDEGWIPSSESARVTDVTLPFLSTQKIDLDRLRVFSKLKTLQITDIPFPDVYDLERTTQIWVDVDKVDSLEQFGATPDHLQVIEEKKADMREVLADFESEYGEKPIGVAY